MSTVVEPEELEVTRGERFLAAILGVFVVIGLLWGYAKLDEPGRPSLTPGPVPAAVVAHDRAARDLATARSTLSRADADLVLRREAYRTALDAGRPAVELEGRYRRAQAARAAALRGVAAAEGAERATAGPAASAQRAAARAQYRASTRHEWMTFLRRLGFVVLVLAAAFWAWVRYRRRASRRQPLLDAAVGSGVVLAAVMAGDYVTDYISWQDLGPLVLSLVGVALSLVAFTALQRAIARRVPGRRVRRSECPFCGYPARGAVHCEGCGRVVRAACEACGAERRVGTQRCGACGGP